MNKTYLRLFLSIISITIVVLLAEIMYFVASTVIIDRRWKAQVFTQYMTFKGKPFNTVWITASACSLL